MKKRYLLILTLLLTIPFLTYAASDPRILDLTADTTESKINYTGEVEDGMYAVMCKLYNSDNEELDMLSSQVDNKKFSGSFTNLSNGKYSVVCARYEVGEVKKVDVTLGETANLDTNSDTKETTSNTSNTSNTEKNPKTYDVGIKTNIIILIMSIVGIIGSTIYLTKRKSN